MFMIEDHYQCLAEKLSEVKQGLLKLSPQQILWIAPQIESLYNDLENLRNRPYVDCYDSCGKQVIHIGESV